MGKSASVLKYDPTWNVGPDSSGPARVEGVAIPVGLATRHYCSLQGISPKGPIVRRAISIAQDRGNKMIWLEDLMSSVAKDSADSDEVAEIAQTTRTSQARDRRKSRKATVESQAKAKAKARKAKRDAAKKAKEANA